MIDLLNRFMNLWWRLKSKFFYAPFFGTFGHRSLLQPPLFLSNTRFIHIGSRVLIRRGVRLEVVQPQNGVVPRLAIGDDCNIEQNVHIVCGNRVEIGKDVSITANCAIVDVTHPLDGPDNVKIGETIKPGDSYVYIGDGSFLGIGTVVLPNVRIGKRVVVGANSVVTSDLPDFCVAAGAPARVHKTYR